MLPSTFFQPFDNADHKVLSLVHIIAILRGDFQSAEAESREIYLDSEVLNNFKIPCKPDKGQRGELGAAERA